MKQKLQNVLAAFQTAAAGKATSACAQVVISDGVQDEINFTKNAITLMRTVRGQSASLNVILDDKKGSLSVNQLSDEALQEAVETVIEMALASEPDPANCIASKEEGPTQFQSGPDSFDKEALFERTQEFLADLKTEFPSITAEGYLSFEQAQSFWANTNGVEFHVKKGSYSIFIEFTSSDSQHSSSMNYLGIASRDLSTRIMESADLRNQLRQCVLELNAKGLNDKFVGDIVLYPSCASEFAELFTGTYLSTTPLMTKTTPLADSLGKEVANPLVTLVSTPTDPNTIGYSITGDGYRARDITVIEKGTLKTFLLGEYGSRKTGKERSGNIGDYIRFLPGTTPLKQLLAGIKRGVLVCRFSGGSPNDAGDLSGVAKNSFLIENGEITIPITETMISGNLLSMLKNVRAVSAETVSNGMTANPWVHISDVTISSQ
jgi:PmbA protein